MASAARFLRTKGGKGVFLASVVLTAGICLAMNLFLLPAIEQTTAGIRCFDMNPGYDFAAAQRFLSLLSPDGRALYLHVQLPLDFLYPLAYGCCFGCLLFYLTGRFSALHLLPLLLAAFDYAENISILRMLTVAELSPALAAAGSVFTTVKTVLLYLNGLVLLICAVRRLVRRRGNDKSTSRRK